jgi:hypothetical protein
VFHKDGIGMDFETEVRDLITGNKDRVHLLNWGAHQATNDYSGVPNVILAGTLFYRPSYYEALARLAVDRRPAKGSIDDATFDDVMKGEHRSPRAPGALSWHCAALSWCRVRSLQRLYYRRHQIRYPRGTA